MIADKHERRPAPLPQHPQHRVQRLHGQAAARMPEVACGSALGRVSLKAGVSRPALEIDNHGSRKHPQLGISACYTMKHSAAVLIARSKLILLLSLSLV